MRLVTSGIVASTERQIVLALASPETTRRCRGSEEHERSLKTATPLEITLPAKGELSSKVQPFTREHKGKRDEARHKDR